MPTLNKTVWTTQLMEKFYPDDSFLSYARDFSEFVNNDTIIIGEAGIDPNVLVNNDMYPINVTLRSDTPYAFVLDQFDTENTLVLNAEQVERAYNMLESHIYGHRNQLRKTVAIRAAYAFTPSANGANTPVVPTTGSTDGNGKKALTINDILNIKAVFDNNDYPTDKRVLVLHPRHVRDLLLIDLLTFKDIADLKEGKPSKFAGFNILQFSQTPTFNKSTQVRAAYGAAAVPSTDTFCSFAFYGDEMMKADGTIQLFEKVDDPMFRGTIIGFQKRFIAAPIRLKGMGAIVSVDA
ncbi:MAG: phage capsid protein [Bacteroidia bacterium]|nr:phage capsid protein [Bacteroidia bacterium]